MDIKPVPDEVMAQIKVERKARAAEIAKVWRDGLSHKDWLFDGRPIRGERMIDRFNKLDWGKAWIDLGPSVAGSLGPYWHVPLHYDDDDTVHRLYPKVLQTKWALLVLHACHEAERRALGE